MRLVFSGGPVEHSGRELSIPYRGPDARDAPEWSSLMEMNPDIPILVGAGGPKMLELAGDLGDGVLPIGFAPGMTAAYAPLLEKGFARADMAKSMADFPFWVHVDAIVDDDVRAAMQPFKEYVAYYAATLRQQMIFPSSAQ